MLILRMRAAQGLKVGGTGGLMDNSKQTQPKHPEAPKRDGSPPSVPERYSGQGSQSALDRLRAVERRKASSRSADEKGNARL